MSQPTYPAHWEADVVLSDGGTAHLRPIRPADADRLRTFYTRVSAESIYYRFFSPRPRLSDKEIEHFTTVDYSDRTALIAVIGEEMVGVVRYDRTKEPGEAEVAFLIEDAHQGRGVGSVLLEHIAAAARERGVERFVAHVLPDNRKMTKVFRDAGYAVAQRFEDGVLQLHLDLAPTETSREVMTAREHRAESRSIERLLFPRSVAVIGASRDSHSVGQTVLRHLLGADFTGPVYPVHPEAKAVAGVRAYARVLEIPDEVDLAVVAVPAESVHEVVAQCAGKGVHGLVVVSAGFAEVGPEGARRQEHLVKLARLNGMRVVGPNCLGIANTDPAVKLNATLAPVMPGRGSVGFFSQSGALGIAILQRTAERGLGLSTFVSAGNRADVSGNDLMQYWEEDPSTSAVLLYLESIGNPRKFTRLARRLSRSKPIVAVKTGRSTQGVPAGHAVRDLSLPDHAVSALFEQAGVLRVDDLGELFDVAQLLAYQPLPAGNRVAVIDNADSLGLLARDAAAALGLDPRTPVTLGPAAKAADYEHALAEALADPGVDAVVVLYTPPVIGGAELMFGKKPGNDSVAAVLREASAGARKPVLATYLGAKGMPRDLRLPEPDGEAGPGSVPSYPAPEDAMRALAYAARYAGWRRRPHGIAPELEVDRDTARDLIAGWLAGDGEPDAAALLACYGITVGGDAPGLALHLVTQEDPSFGPVVSFRLADVAAELMDDRAYRLAPLTDVEAAGMVRAIRLAPLLFGHQGGDPVDVAALEDLLIRVALLAADHPEVARLELDPVTARPDGLTVGSATLRIAEPAGLRPELEPRRMRPL
ncbi:bifunctional GNAT family N-acetyltransferase/acetate--CoA ligase family protein [Actinocorallia lasiicapitis]